MTLLESFVVRQARGIDTFERGLAYAALALRASNTNPANTPAGKDNKYFNVVKVVADLTTRAGDKIEPVLRIEAKLPYDAQRALLRGGNFAESVGDYANTTPALSIKCAPSNPNHLFILEEPAWVNTLEKYLVWCAHNLIEGHANLGSIPIPITSNFIDDGSNEPSLTITALLKFDLISYLNGNNLVAAIKSQIMSAVELESSAIVSSSLMRMSSAGTSFRVADIHASSVAKLALAGRSSNAKTEDLIQSQSTGLMGLAGTSTKQITEDAISVSSTQKLSMKGTSSVSIGNNSAANKPYLASQSSAYSATIAIGTYANLTDGIGTTGAGTNSTPLSWIKAKFENPVSVKSITVGGGSLANWDSDVAAYLNAAKIEYSFDDGTWVSVFTVSGVTNSGVNQFKTFTLPNAISAQYWRLAKASYLGTTEFKFG